MAFGAGVTGGERDRHPHLDAPNALAPQGIARGFRRSQKAVLTRGASFLPPKGGGGARLALGLVPKVIPETEPFGEAVGDLVPLAASSHALGGVPAWDKGAARPTFSLTNEPILSAASNGGVDRLI